MIFASLHGKRILVTGSSTGIGRAIVLECARENSRRSRPSRKLFPKWSYTKSKLNRCGTRQTTLTLIDCIIIATYVLLTLGIAFIYGRKASDRHYAWASRCASVLVLIAGGVAAWIMRGKSIDSIWNILLALGAGTGAVFMLRWFWWRINAWTEISAMLASLVPGIFCRQVNSHQIWSR